MALAAERHDAGGERAFRVTAALLFAASALATVWWCGSMSGGMPMPGGWTMSMAWVRMPGQTWPAAAASFMGMWVLMMLAMMLPSLVPMLSRYRRAVRVMRNERRLARLTAVAGGGYFFAWAIVGVAVYPVGVVLAAAEMTSLALARAVPVATGVVLVLAGCVQLTAWKARALAHCRDVPCGRSLPADARTAWSHGVDLGLHCGLCCSGLMAALLVTDVMGVPTMALIAAAITAERLAPKPERVARATGFLLIATGVFEIAHAGL